MGTECLAIRGSYFLWGASIVGGENIALVFISAVMEFSLLRFRLGMNPRNVIDGELLLQKEH